MQKTETTHERWAFGFIAEQKAFEERNRKFLQALSELDPLIDLVFCREVPHSSRADLLVFATGRLTIEDFKEMILLAANGYGIGAQKLLRGMYERAVTMTYISSHPAEAQKVVDYLQVERKKIANRLDSAKLLFLGQEHHELQSEIKSSYQAVKDEFTPEKCPKCKHQPMPSWTKLSLDAMATQAGYGLIDGYGPGYLIPTQKVHATSMAVAERLKARTGSQAIFISESQVAEADFAMSVGHWLLIIVLRVQKDYFNLGIGENLDVHDQKCKEIWKNRRPS